jgi:hypothetical protein
MEQKIKEQILAIRDTGLTNMFDIGMVQRLAYERDFYELVKRRQLQLEERRSREGGSNMRMIELEYPARVELLQMDDVQEYQRNGDRD